MQDRLNRLGVVQESIPQQGGRVPDDLKAAADALSPNVADSVRDVDQKIVDPLTKAMSEDKLSLKDLDQYLYARHAPTRNAVIAQRNPGVVDGSGMTDADAARILADFQARGLTPALQRAEAFIRQARDEQFRVPLDGGLISQAQATSWKNTMGDEYVPLRSVEVDEGIGNGSGFDILSPDDPLKPLMLQMHAYTGGSIALLLVVRLVMRFTTKRPAPADAGNVFLNFLGKAVHFLLYLFLIGMAVSGLGLFQMADVPAIFSGSTPYPKDFFVYLPRIGHGLTSTVLLMLVLLHFGAAMYDQFIRKDNLLARMWFGK